MSTVEYEILRSFSTLDIREEEKRKEKGKVEFCL
jgi:hypothetical protein